MTVRLLSFPSVAESWVDIYVLKTDFDEALATLQSLATDHNAYANYVREKRVFRQERYEVYLHR